jgi:membrane protein
VASNTAGLLGVLKDTWKDFFKDECPRMAAALAYYTIFALPPLLALLVMAAGQLWNPEEVERALQAQFAGLIGSDAAGTVQEMIRKVDRPGTNGFTLASIGSLGALAFGATGAFVELQSALNRAWKVQPDPKQGGIRNFILKRALSLGMVLGIAFMIAVSLALTAAISAMGNTIGSGFPEPALHLLNVILTFVVLAFLFAAMFKVLPDAKLGWRDVLVGGAVTSLLFGIGKFLIGFYLGRSNPGSPFGAAASLAVILVWIYYAGIILLLGAEFTESWAASRGNGVQPENGAARVERKEQIKQEG